MPYDEGLAERDVSERKMFGGLAFLVAGRMALAASRDGGILVRVDPADVDALVEKGPATVAIMGSREMRGWVRVPGGVLRTDRQLAGWVRRGIDHARSLAPGARRRSR
jgi:TfoX/Sxy family transcriptional regulator of competence genes